MSFDILIRCFPFREWLMSLVLLRLRVFEYGIAHAVQKHVCDS